MALSPTRRRFTVKDYHRMAEAEVFHPDDRVELVDGEVLDLAPIGSRHAACVKRMVSLFSPRIADRGILGVQDPVDLDDRSEPQPDLALLLPRADFYAAGHPVPSDVLLVVEVTLVFDLERKVPLYLQAGIPEVWVVDVVREAVHVAVPGDTRVVSRGESLAPLAFPDLVLAVADIVG